jgi:nicotinamidase-related amidase
MLKSGSPNQPGLLVIDVQNGIDDAEYWGGNRNNPEAEGNIKLLVACWKKKDFPIFVIRHLSVFPSSPFFPGQIGCELKDFIKAEDGLIRVDKSTANAFINTALESQLRGRNVGDIFITGFITNNSVEATARMAGELGFNTCVVSDATATFNKAGLDGNVYSSELIHQISLANLNGEYASVKTTYQVIEQVESY